MSVKKKNPRERLTIEEMHEVAKSRGGKCLSKIYTNNKTELKWQCANGHSWDARPDATKRGHWCPECKKNRTEKKVRFIFENLLGVPFPTTRKVLNGYELDGYNKKFNLAFEFHGIQHYKFIEFFHGTIDNFNERCNVDKEKERRCEDKKINLIIIPYNEAKIDEKLVQFICHKLEELNIEIKYNKIDLSPFYENNNTLTELRILAENRLGKLLSNSFTDYNTDLEWECEFKHTWKASASSVKHSESWCPHCAGVAKLTIEEMRKIAKSRNGKCLSVKYINATTELEWECEFGHRWFAMPSNVKHNNTWCDVCGGSEPLTIEEMHDIAKKHDGKCLSTEYINNKTHLEWECEKEHTWFARPSDVKNKETWCKRCATKLANKKRAAN